MNDNNNNLLNVLTREGVLINVSVRYWRGTKKLKPEDIGLSSNDLSERLISLGHKRLLPKDALQELALVESRAHALIDGNTFPFLNGLGHFLPNGKLAEVTNSLSTLEQDFRSAKQKFVFQYAKLRADASQEWRRAAEKLVDDPDRMVAAIEAAFPASRVIDRFFAFDVQVFQISLPESLSVDLISLAEQRDVINARDAAARQAAQKIRNDTEVFVAECVAALREQTATLCEEMLSSINNSEAGVHQKTLNRLVRFIDQFKQMNFANDRVMEEQLETVRKELLNKTAEEYRDNASARKRLVNGLLQLGDKARELAAADATHLVQSFGQVGRRKLIWLLDYGRSLANCSSVIQARGLFSLSQGIASKTRITRLVN
jgi:hypothetical protein